jgi:hypothetical protein
MRTWATVIPVSEAPGIILRGYRSDSGQAEMRNRRQIDVRHYPEVARVPYNRFYE